ncbi:lipase_3 domain-containing protein, partial [Haematococcus lacustris]
MASVPAALHPDAALPNPPNSTPWCLNGSLPLQTHYAAILKFSGVPEQDVLLAVWRSQTFQPAHYVARDVARSKLVICISCHSGMLQAAQWVLASVEQEVLAALQAQPCLDLMVTGHSMGGGIAALLALMLRHDPRLSMRTRSRLRAVCLAPAAVLGHSLAVACRDFVVSVINNNDLVPRVSIHSLSTFVHQVAAASPLQQAMAALARL